MPSKRKRDRNKCGMFGTRTVDGLKMRINICQKSRSFLFEFLMCLEIASTDGIRLIWNMTEIRTKRNEMKCGSNCTIIYVWFKMYLYDMVDLYIWIHVWNVIRFEFSWKGCTLLIWIIRPNSASSSSSLLINRMNIYKCAQHNHHHCRHFVVMVATPNAPIRTYIQSIIAVKIGCQI